MPTISNWHASVESEGENSIDVYTDRVLLFYIELKLKCIMLISNRQ